MCDDLKDWTRRPSCSRTHASRRATSIPRLFPLSDVRRARVTPTRVPLPCAGIWAEKGGSPGLSTIQNILIARLLEYQLFKKNNLA